MGRDRYKIRDPAAPPVLTFTALLWFPLFAQPANARILLDSLQYLQAEGDLTIYGYAILEW
jgi:putative transposase